MPASLAIPKTGDTRRAAKSASTLRVVQSVFGKFHHFDLARQFHRHGMLEKIFSGYPRWKLSGEGVPAEKLSTFPWLQTVLMAKWRFKMINPRLDRELSWLAIQSLDAYVAGRLPECDVFVAISGSGLMTSRRAQQAGARYVCDRGSAHIRRSDALLRAEFARWGQKFPGVDERLIFKEEAEYEAADAITVPSTFSERSFFELGVPKAKLRKIPYGVDLSRFKKITDPDRDSFEVLFAGQVSFRKGVPYLLEAFAKLRHSRKRLRLVGAMQPEMARFLREHPYDSVQFLGPVPQASLIEYMSSSHVLVLPSVEDGFGLVLNQAMACGCPVICSQHTAAEDVMTHGVDGLVVPICDSNAIRLALERLCQNPGDRQRMGEAAMARVKSLGGWNDYGEAFASLCHDLTTHKNLSDEIQLSENSASNFCVGHSSPACLSNDESATAGR